MQGLVPPQQLPSPEVAAKRSEGMLAADSLRTLAFAHRQARDDCRAAADTAALYGACAGTASLNSPKPNPDLNLTLTLTDLYLLSERHEEYHETLSVRDSSQHAQNAICRHHAG
jgi:hypothetical protein